MCTVCRAEWNGVTVLFAFQKPNSATVCQKWKQSARILFFFYHAVKWSQSTTHKQSNNINNNLAKKTLPDLVQNLFLKYVLPVALAATWLCIHQWRSLPVVQKVCQGHTSWKVQEISRWILRRHYSEHRVHFLFVWDKDKGEKKHQTVGLCLTGRAGWTIQDLKRGEAGKFLSE